jgi:hypothetical protein
VFSNGILLTVYDPPKLSGSVCGFHDTLPHNRIFDTAHPVEYLVYYRLQIDVHVVHVVPVVRVADDGRGWRT